MAKRRTPTFRKVYQIEFTLLPGDTQNDVAICLAARLRRDTTGQRDLDGDGKNYIYPDEVRAALERLNPRVWILMVKTKALVAAPREVYDDPFLEYKAGWESGAAAFPPVVIDSTDEILLCEGGHRSFSAHAAGVREIEAVDVGDIDPVPVFREIGWVERP